MDSKLFSKLKEDKRDIVHSLEIVFKQSGLLGSLYFLSVILLYGNASTLIENIPNLFCSNYVGLFYILIQ